MQEAGGMEEAEGMDVRTRPPRVLRELGCGRWPDAC